MSLDCTARRSIATGPFKTLPKSSQSMFQTLFFEVLTECAGIETLFPNEPWLALKKVQVQLDASGSCLIPLAQTAAHSAYCAGRTNGTYLDDEIADRASRSRLFQEAKARFGDEGPYDGILESPIAPEAFWALSEKDQKGKGLLRWLVGRT